MSETMSETRSDGVRDERGRFLPGHALATRFSDDGANDLALLKTELAGKAQALFSTKVKLAQ